MAGKPPTGNVADADPRRAAIAQKGNPRTNLLDPQSLAATLDALNDAHFCGHPPPRAQREQVARWIAGRQGLPRSYADMFAPTDQDFRSGARVFTGEWVRSGAALRHILGEEACRALILLRVRAPAVQSSLVRAQEGIQRRLSHGNSRRLGMYCCGICSCALWRHLAVGGLDDPQGWLTAGMKTLKAHRTGAGRWGRFPFWYTLLVLSELDLPAALREARYAAAVCDRLLRRRAPDAEHAIRRRLLAERILAM